jgi:myo-inositol-1(or 4)-monophosphatase
MILNEIRSNFSSDSILSEESGLDDRGSEFMWIVDPIDGTTNFYIGNPVFTTSIALAYKSDIVLGATYHPILDQIFYVEKGEGFYLNSKKQAVSDTVRLEDAFIAFCHAADPIAIKKIINIYCKLKPRVKAVRQLGAASFELALIAAGKIDAFLMPGVKAWDVATGVLMVTEAGGETIDFSGRKWSIKSKDLLTCNSKIRNELLNLL